VELRSLAKRRSRSRRRRVVFQPVDASSLERHNAVATQWLLVLKRFPPVSQFVSSGMQWPLPGEQLCN